MKIFHAADIHLGRCRLDGRLPDSDIRDAFQFIADQAIQEKADVFLLAGDLFDRPQVEPPHLRQACGVLQRLKAAGIPVLAIEGNHDRQFVHTEVPTWVRYLAEDDLLMLLRPDFSAQGVALPPWNPQTKAGAWKEIGGVRFVGAGYLGAATPHKLKQIVEALEPGLTHVLLLHAGPEYFVGEGGGFSGEDLEMARAKVSYLALGHIHKPMLHKGWACNPGSPENCELREAAYSTDAQGNPVQRGYAVVTLLPGPSGTEVAVEIRSNPRRPSLRIELDCTPFGSQTRRGEDSFFAAALRAIRAQTPSAQTVVELVLKGNLNLDRIPLDTARFSNVIAEQAGVFAVALNVAYLNVAPASEGGAGTETAPVTRMDLEQNAIRELLDKETLWGLPEEKTSVAELFYTLKEMVLHDNSAEMVAERISCHPLIEKIRLAQAVTRSTATASPAAEVEVL